LALQLKGVTALRQEPPITFNNARFYRHYPSQDVHWLYAAFCLRFTLTTAAGTCRHAQQKRGFLLELARTSFGAILERQIFARPTPKQINQLNQKMKNLRHHVFKKGTPGFEPGTC
jgi:hypothetical protein